MRLPRINYRRPATIDEALSILAGPSTALIHAGGTDLVPALQEASWGEVDLVAVGRLGELRGISARGDALHIGALTTIAELAEHAAIRADLPGLAEAAAGVASPQIRNRATVGGNLLVDHRCVHFNQTPHHKQSIGPCFKAGGNSCHLVPRARRGRLPLCRARFVSDLAPVLIACGAQIEVRRLGARRTVALRDFYRPDGISRHDLDPRELITEVIVERRPHRFVGYAKLRIRNTLDFPSLGVALDCVGEPGAAILTIAFTGVDNHPVWMTASQSDHPDWDALVDAAAAGGRKAISVLRQDFFPPQYRRHMAGVLVRRLAERARRARSAASGVTP